MKTIQSMIEDLLETKKELKQFELTRAALENKSRDQEKELAKVLRERGPVVYRGEVYLAIHSYPELIKIPFPNEASTMRVTS